MSIRNVARLAALIAVGAIVAGCGEANDGNSTAPELQLRLVTSSADGSCTAEPLTADGPGAACDRVQNTTYELAKSLGAVTPRTVTRYSQGSEHTVNVDFDTANTATLNDVFAQAMDRQLALLLDGEVLSAPTIKSPTFTGRVEISFETADEADQIAAELGGSPTP